MNLKDKGLIIYVKIIKENNLLIKLLTKNNGLKITMVYGGNSRKNKSIYQLGNFINFNLTQKNENSLSSISGDLQIPLMSNIFNNKYKLYCVMTCCSLINTTINENQRFDKIFLESEILFTMLNNQHWFYNYTTWMLNFLSELGYGFDWKEIILRKRYIYLENLQFYSDDNIKILNNQFVEFPYDLIIDKIITLKECKVLFFIFEHIMTDHILHLSTRKIPKVYFDFKKIIINNLKK